MPRQTEPNANNAMGGLLQSMLPRSHVISENTQAIAGRPGLRPDILITAPGRAPVVVEAEYLPAATVEPEAKDRLGLEMAVTRRPIEAAIALRYPEDVAEAHDLHAALPGRSDEDVGTQPRPSGDGLRVFGDHVAARQHGL